MNCVAVVKAARKYPHLKIFVTVLCDTGSRYQSKFYSRDYLDKNKIKFEPLESYDKINFVLWISLNIIFKECIILKLNNKT